MCEVDAGARRTAAKARRPSIVAQFEGGVALVVGMPRLKDTLDMTETGH